MMAFLFSWPFISSLEQAVPGHQELWVLTHFWEAFFATQALWCLWVCRRLPSSRWCDISDRPHSPGPRHHRSCVKRAVVRHASYRFARLSAWSPSWHLSSLVLLTASPPHCLKADFGTSCLFRRSNFTRDGKVPAVWLRGHFPQNSKGRQ